MRIVLFLFLVFNITVAFGQADSVRTKQEQDYQIHLTSPAKAIRYIMYDKDFMPIQGRISEDKKAIIIKNYIKGSKVRLKVEYEDGTSEEILRSPCFIDPVVEVDPKKKKNEKLI